MKYLLISVTAILLTFAESQSVAPKAPCNKAESYNFKVTLRSGKVIMSYKNEVGCDGKTAILTTVEQQPYDCSYYCKKIVVKAEDILEVEPVRNPSENDGKRD